MNKRGKTEQEWRALLSEQEFAVCRLKGTERAFSGQYWDCRDSGRYLCRCCDALLFDSSHKYDSGTGWPSFYQPNDEQALELHSDSSLGMVRTEVCCRQCGAHLGHVFEDGPQPSGLRYCINSLSLRLQSDQS